jgi:hypothetical protein
MKLLAFKINNEPITNIVNWSISQLNGNQPFLVSDTTIQDYDDVSSIINWDKYGNKIKDFIFVRNEIKLIYDLTSYDNLSYDEKIIISKYFLTNQINRNLVIGSEEQEKYWSELVKLSRISRFNRWEASRIYISYRLEPINSSDLAKSTTELCNDYINYNITTRDKDGTSGLFDYLKGEEDYLFNGYPSKSYWLQSDQDRLMDILENGNY